MYDVCVALYRALNAVLVRTYVLVTSVVLDSVVNKFERTLLPSNFLVNTSDT